MNEMLYKMKLFGYQKFELKTSNSKSELIDILKRNIKTTGPFTSLFNSIKEYHKNGKLPETIYPFHGNITQDGFLIKSSTQYRLNIYGTFEETLDGTKVTVVVKEQRSFILEAAFFMFVAIPIILWFRSKWDSSHFYAMIPMFIILRLVVYGWYRKELSDIKKFLPRVLSK